MTPSEAEDSPGPDDELDTEHADVRDSESSDPTPADQPAPSIWDRTDWAACGLLLVASLLLVGLHVRNYETLSPIDELQHIDYVIRAGNFDIPLRNERVGAEAMTEAACRSVDAPGYAGPACGLDSYDPSDFQESGINTAASQFPPYYVATGVPARFLTAIGVFDSKVTAARMLGAIWLAGALAITWYIMACLDLRRRARAAVMALLLVTPFTIFHAGATVNADVSLMLTGALVVLATIKYEAGRLRWWWLALLSVGTLFVEATNMLAIAACGLYLMARRLPDVSLTPLQRFAPLGILPALLFFRVEATSRVQNWLWPTVPRQRVDGVEVTAPMFTNHRTTGVSFDKVLGQLNSTFTPVRNPYLSPPLRSQITLAGIELANWLLIALLFVAAFIAVGSMRAAWMSRIAIVMLLAAGPFYTFYFAYFSNQDFPAPARFALPLIPLLAVAATSALQQRHALWAVYGVAGITGINTLYQLLTA